MGETFKLNMLGDTCEQQWLNAVHLYCLVIRTNAENVKPKHEREVILRTLDDLESEVCRFIKGVFDTEGDK